MTRPDAPRRRAHAAVRALRALALALLGVAVFIALALAFDDAWLRPWLRHYVRTHADRSLQASAIHLRFHGSLDPTFEFHDVEVENAPWAAKRPMVKARFTSATVAWRSLLPGRLTVMPLVTIDGGDVDLERSADGLRNYRISNPQDRGPATVVVQAARIRDSTLHAVHAAIALEGDARVTPLPAPRTLPDYPGQPLTQWLEFSGRYQGRPFDGQTAVSDIVYFGQTDDHFTVDGWGRMDGFRMTAHGVTADLHALADTDIAARLTTEGQGDLWPLPLRQGIARVRPLVATAHIVKRGPAWDVTGMRATLGRGTSWQADLHILDEHAQGRRRALRAAFAEATLDWRDLQAMFDWQPGSAPATPKATAPPASAASTARTGDGRASADDRFRPASMRSVDIDLTLPRARLTGTPNDLARSLALKASLVDGVLALTDLDLGVADGHLRGRLDFDGRTERAASSLALTAQGLRLGRLSPKLGQDGGLDGAVDGRATLRGEGASLRGLASTADGELRLALAPGASVSTRLDAKLGLDGGEWLKSVFDRSARVPVTCGALALAVADGHARVASFAFRTERTALAARGAIDLAGETLDLTLMPVRPERSLLRLDRSIHASGPWKSPRVALEAPVAGLAPGGCPAR